MRKLIANLTENARLFAETRKLLGSGGKVLEVVEDEQEQAPEVAPEFYPASMNGSAPAEANEASSPQDTTPANTTPKPIANPSSPGNGNASAGGNGSAKLPHNKATPAPAGSNGNGSGGGSGLNQVRNEFLAAARRVATSQKRTIGEIVEWASGGAFKYADIGRMTEADAPKLQAATEFMASALAGAAR